jgi:hypothetical protein
MRERGDLVDDLKQCLCWDRRDEGEETKAIETLDLCMFKGEGRSSGAIGFEVCIEFRRETVCLGGGQEVQPGIRGAVGTRRWCFVAAEESGGHT